MPDMHELSIHEKDFLRPYLPVDTSSTQGGHDGECANATHTLPGDSRISPRPFVTLTYACSLDGMISLAPRVRTTLSGLETKAMTHYLRLNHDAILVGVGTAVADDPGLNCRYPGVTIDNQPRPVIVDPAMRWEVHSSKVNNLAAEKQGKDPWIIHTRRILEGKSHLEDNAERIVIDGNDPTQETLCTHDATTVHHKVQWEAILEALKQRDINSVMIEGGATVIKDLLSHPQLVDAVIVTIAPTWLGQGGVTISPEPTFIHNERVNAARLHNTKWHQFGQDVVLCGSLGG